MSDDEVRRRPESRGPSCPFAWCTTRHGQTTHEADEDHRSGGRSLTLTLRDGRDGAAIATADVEVGLLHRRSDSRTWLVIENGRDIRVQITAESAHDLLAAVLADPAVADELGVATAEGDR
ncbi:hypothetical protein DEU34_0749 [Microbacterium sp. AG1240]|uniref:hypothetical protein n=1 Tax=Microbacterium sp. AG1240 TaxID=2183992 RepID=UPI000EB4D312|nr:hypothetical protein [Microbacterium sp. AG1240]RKT36238.1 hypothetical protein DEU34_0749 [Microbacterium sp. AG1240]